MLMTFRTIRVRMSYYPVTLISMGMIKESRCQPVKTEKQHKKISA